MKLIELNHFNQDKYLDKIIRLDEQEMPFPWTKSQWGDALTSTPAPLVSFYISEQNLLAFSLWSLVDSECAHLLKVATSEYYRRRGCARGLIEEDLENLAMRDYRRFYLEVGSENLKAINFYETLGFRKVHLKRSFYSDGSDAYAMHLSLN